MEVYVALYVYVGCEDEELSFTKGQLCRVIKKDKSGWWYVRIEGKTGFIPANYFELAVKIFWHNFWPLYTLLKYLHRK